jgi:hypothetical protein
MMLCSASGDRMRAIPREVPRPIDSPGPGMGARLSVDTSQWPLVVLTFSGKPTDEQIAAHLKEVEERVLVRGERFVQVIDQTHGEMPSPRQRALIADHQARMEHLYRRHCRGEAYAVSEAIRGAMIAVFWIAKPPYPYVFVDNLAAGVEWARRLLQEPGTGV